MSSPLDFCWKKEKQKDFRIPEQKRRDGKIYKNLNIRLTQLVVNSDYEGELTDTMTSPTKGSPLNLTKAKEGQWIICQLFPTTLN